ncbi:uncharacterized protein K02A2.6-like [Lytechinus pictus]|uniref:uncharacterized protein K02A2.6-like n=1 Tax=Lytechinus pictus TaxID=7653 RepID=UPI0030B9EAD2
MATPSGYIGRLGSFEKAREPFTSYVERMELFFMANNIVETSQNAEFVKERKKAILLTEIGTEIYVTLANLLAPSKPKDATFDDIIDKLKNHFDPKPLEIAESYKFGTRNQKQGETVGEFIIALKNLSLHCNYGSFLNRALRDRFVCGLADERIQNKLLNTQDLDFDKACQIALSMEMASINARELRSVHNAGSVNSQKSYTRKAKPTSRGGKPKPSNAESKKHGNCYRCNSRNHPPQECPFKGSQCFKCEMKGHIAKACKSNRGKSSVPSKGKSRRSGGNAEVHALDETDDLENSMQHNLNLYCVYATDSINKFETEVVINKKSLTMRIDTQADCSIMSKDTYERNFSDVPLRPNSLELRTYSGQQLDLCGEFECEVTYEGNTLLLPMMVTSYTNRPTLMGKNWLTKLKLDWNNVFHVESSKLQSLLRQYSGMFEDSYEGISGVEAHVRIKENSTPVYCRPRPVPYALKEKVEKELRNLEKNKVIVKTDYSDWATPIVVVPKADGGVRLCGDYKTTVNRAVDDECYPLPTSQDLYAELGGTKVFSKLDLSHAYAQLNLDQQSQQYLTINTHMGLYSYTKLPYGIKSSPKIFQATMDKILQGIPHCLCNQDDVLIATTTVDENLDVLAQVLKRLNDHNVKLKRSKCAFVESEVVYLGLKVSSQGLQPVKEKIEPIINAPKPKNVTELRSFLGMVQFYSRFLPDLASVLAPLHKLLQKEQKWEWSKAQQEAYEKCKRMLTSDALLVHYDNRRELKMSCDASSYGVGAVISHVMDNGETKPIAFASRTLTKSERNYAQIEKEALGIIFGIKKFHQYLLGRNFTLITDHKPLLHLLGPKSSIPTMAASRMQRWAILLSQYDYNIEYLSSKENAVADALSRLPHEDSEDGTEGSIYVTDVVDSNFPVTATEIAAETQKDSVLKQVYEQTLYGWSETEPMNDELKPYHSRRFELSCDQGCVKWGHRVIIPKSLRHKLLDELHSQHSGVVAMKAVARGFMFWPGIDKEIEQISSRCSVCQNVRSKPPRVPLETWRWPARPFQRVHVDFCEFDSEHFLVLIDSHSKWIEVIHMGTNTTTEKTMNELRSIFACHGLPEQLVSDNGPQFRSAAFQTFMKQNGIRHILVPTYHPASNGAAERTVRVVKEALKKQVFDGSSKFSMKRRLANFLLKYRTTPQSTTGFTPAELLMKRRLRTRLSLILPDLSQKVENKQSSQKRYFKGSRRYRSFDVGENVRILAPPHKEGKWELGEVVTVCGSRRYLVDISGRVRSVHVNHMLKASDNQECLPESSDHADLDDSFDLISLPDSAQSRQLNSEVGIEKSPVKSTSGLSTDTTV